MAVAVEVVAVIRVMDEVDRAVEVVHTLKTKLTLLRQELALL
tara:strand:+ start:254 stop:379 length:126 start_codon:yes stop_codon:yes gene_type:complete